MIEKSLFLTRNVYSVLCILLYTVNFFMCPVSCLNKNKKCYGIDCIVKNINSGRVKIHFMPKIKHSLASYYNWFKRLAISAKKQPYIASKKNVMPINFAMFNPPCF
jgi:acylphosphatase